MSTMITGGTGFLGAYLTRYLLDQDDDVVIFDYAPDMSRIEGVADRVRVVQGDITELAEVLDAMQSHDVTRVVHLAYVLSGLLDIHPLRGIKVNCDGTANVFEAARLHGIQRVVYGSSITSYGIRWTLSGEEVDEDVNPRPDTLYGACKQFNERTADLYTKRYGMELIGMRPTSIFGLGRGQRVTSQISAQHFMVQPEIAALGLPAVMPPDDHESDWMYAADAAYAFYLALTVPVPEHRVFNMASYRYHQRDITALVRRLVPDADITIGNEPVAALNLVSRDRLHDELGFEPRYTLEAAMREYLGLVRARAGLSPLP